MSDLALLRAAPHDRVANLVGCGVSPEIVERLMGSPRLELRLSSLISSYLGPPGEVSRDQAAVLAMTSAEHADLATLAGLVWHGGRIAQMIDRASRDAVLARFGEHGYGVALAGLHLSRPVEDAALPPDKLGDRVTSDGLACLAAWCDAQPPTVAGRLRLVLPENSADAVHHEHGPAIVTWVLER